MTYPRFRTTRICALLIVIAGVSPARVPVPTGDHIPLLFSVSPADSIHTTFVFERKTDTWNWLIDDDSNGKTQRFADVRLSRAP